MNGTRLGAGLREKLDAVFKGKHSRTLLFVGIAGMALIFLSTVIQTGGSNKPNPSVGAGQLTSQEYVAQLEERLTGIVGSIEGVDSLASFATNLKGWLLKKQSAKPIGIDLSDDVAVIELHVNIKAGVNIPETAEKIQSAVKEAVQNMTGIAVSRVNINIAGIVFAEPAEQTEA